MSQGTKINSWTQVEIDLDKGSNQFQIQFIASNDGENTKFLAIDDIQLSSGTCKPVATTTPKPTENPLAVDVTCSFNVSACDWHNTSSPTTNGAFRLSDPYHHKYGLPKYDHFGNNKGKYIYLYNGQSNGSIIRGGMHTIEKYSGKTTYVCLSFWFYMRTDGNANFNLTRFETKR